MIKPMTLNQIKKQSKDISVPYKETLEMAYENISEELKRYQKIVDRVRKCIR